MFNSKELDWIDELVKDRIHEMKSRGDYDIYEYDKKIFESILSKIKYNSIKQHIRDELENADTMHYTEAGYDNWYDFFIDAEYGREDIELYEDIMRKEFTEKQMDEIWENSKIGIYGTKDEIISYLITQLSRLGIEYEFKGIYLYFGGKRISNIYTLYEYKIDGEDSIFKQLKFLYNSRLKYKTSLE